MELQCAFGRDAPVRLDDGLVLGDEAESESGVDPSSVEAPDYENTKRKVLESQLAAHSLGPNTKKN